MGGTGSILPRGGRRDESGLTAMEVDRHDDNGTWPARLKFNFEALPRSCLRTPSTIANGSESEERERKATKAQMPGRTVHGNDGMVSSSASIYHRGCISFFIHQESCGGGVSYFVDRVSVAGALQRPIGWVFHSGLGRELTGWR